MLPGQGDEQRGDVVSCQHVIHGVVAADRRFGHRGIRGGGLVRGDDGAAEVVQGDRAGSAVAAAAGQDDRDRPPGCDQGQGGEQQVGGGAVERRVVGSDQGEAVAGGGQGVLAGGMTATVPARRAAPSRAAETGRAQFRARMSAR
jgi:hypothetical protein